MGPARDRLDQWWPLEVAAVAEEARIGVKVLVLYILQSRHFMVQGFRVDELCTFISTLVE